MSDDTELPDGVDESEREAFEAWIANGNEPDADEFRDAYAGEWSTLGEYCEEMFDEREFENVWYYIDFDLMARDWQLNGDIWAERASGGTYHVFRNY